ncbi:hypothetical protein FACS1894126_2160 [Alphaproteobacteria bacterium]|nr:hypothetical protein FACS1894126_2160 [Alphaproteobacteria bacterium]
MNHDITELFCFIDDFYLSIKRESEKQRICNGEKIRNPTRTPGLTDSEIMTIMLMFQDSPFKNFKYFYKACLSTRKQEFSLMPSYERFVVLMPSVLYLFVILLSCMLRKGSKISYIDSTPLRVCHNKRIYSHKVCKGMAARGKSTMGWFFGFKLHIIIDNEGNLLKVKMTNGSVHDTKVVLQMTEGMTTGVS